MAFLARQLWREVAGSGGKTRPALRALSYLATWGNGDLGRLGHGEACENVEVPVVCSRGLEGAMASRVSCGGAHTLVLDQRGRVFSMGLNDSGQLGLGVNEEYVTEPTLVPGLEGKTVTDIAAGRDHSAVVTSEGEVFVAGSNKKGKLGLGKRSPRMASTFQKTTFSRTTASRRWVWGRQRPIDRTLPTDPLICRPRVRSLSLSLSLSLSRARLRALRSRSEPCTAFACPVRGRSSRGVRAPTACWGTA